MDQTDIPATVFHNDGDVVLELEGIAGGVQRGSVELSPAQARALADALEEAADEAEGRHAHQSHRPNSLSVSQRMSVVEAGSTVIGYVAR